MTENINHPIHYNGDTVYETIKVLEAWLTPEQFIGFCRGNAIKYLSRAGKKNNHLIGSGEEDLKKSEFYTKYEIDYRNRLSVDNIGENRVCDLMGIALNKQQIKTVSPPDDSGGLVKKSL